MALRNQKQALWLPPADRYMILRFHLNARRYTLLHTYLVLFWHSTSDAHICGIAARMLCLFYLYQFMPKRLLRFLFVPSISEPGYCIGRIQRKSGWCLHREWKRNLRLLLRQSQGLN